MAVLVISRFAIFAAMTLVTSVTACTAIVIGKLGDTKDFPLGDADAVPGSSSSSSGALGDAGGPCSLLTSEFGADEPPASDNTCADCIASKCSSDVTYACNGGGQQAKTWFGNLRDCAQHPYFGHGPPEAGSIYDCNTYEDAGPKIFDNGSDAERRRMSELCVQTNCMAGSLPACRQCVVSTTKTGTEEIAYLDKDGCGKCFIERCQEDLVHCCNAKVVTDFLAACAYTADTGNATTCAELGKEGILDASDTSNPGFELANGNDYEKDCLARMANCYRTSCKSRGYQCE